MFYRQCSCAGEFRPIDFFHKDSQNPDGLAFECKFCKNTKRRFYRRYGVSANLTREHELRMIKEIRRGVRDALKSGEAIVG